MRMASLLLAVLAAGAPGSIWGGRVMAQVPSRSKPLGNVATPSATTVTRIIDACQFAPSDTLAKYLESGIAPYFPIEAHKDGHHIKVSNPDVRKVTCPNLRLEVRADVKYQDTRGLVQYSSSGHVRFGSPLRLTVQYQSTPGQPVKPGDVTSARACFTDIKVLELNLNNVPNWIDNTYIRGKLQNKLVPNACVSVLSIVRLYVAMGGTL